VEAVLNKSLSEIANSTNHDRELNLVKNAKEIALRMIGSAYQKYREELEKQQEILMHLSDIIMEVFAMESMLLRSRKLSGTNQGANAAEMTSVFLCDAMNRIETSARNILGACAGGKSSEDNMATLRSLASYDPIDAIQLRRNIAGRLLTTGSYAV